MRSRSSAKIIRKYLVGVDKIVELATVSGLDNINAQEIEELLQTTGESLFNDDLKELVEQQVNEDDEIGVSEDVEQKERQRIFLKNSLDTITEITDQFI